MANQKNVRVQEVTHAEAQKKETFGETAPAPYTVVGNEYNQVPEGVDLDHVVAVPDLSSGPGHRIQVQGVDAPPPAVTNATTPQANAEYVNGVSPTEAQIAAERRNWVDVNGNPVYSQE